MNATKTATKKHIPDATATGLRGPARCGKYADYGTGDHALIRRQAAQAVKDGDAGHYCRKCLKGL